MKKLTLALIGAGERGANCYAPYAKLHGYEVAFIAVADPDQKRRDTFAKAYNVPEGGLFDSADAFFAQPKCADAVLICTQDSQHYAHAVQAIERGYTLLLEKPLSPSPRECLELERLATAHGTTVVVCHVMRYTPFFRKIKELIDGGAIGELVNITHTENIGYWHYAHSYVRGNWHVTKDSSPLILAKCCHDMDILAWLVGSRLQSVSSFGDLKYFNEQHAPEGAPQRCTDGCPHQSECPYYAPKMYLQDDIGWDTIWSCLGGDRSYEARLKALKEGPYGKCVFHNDNDVVDHQIASMRFENGVTVAFTMSAFNNACDRTIKIMGTKGEIRASMDGNIVEVSEFGQGIMGGNVTQYHINHGSSGHSGGDEGIMEDFVRVLKDGKANTNLLSQSVHSHIMSFATEESRLTGKTVNVREYEQSILTK